MGVNCTFPGVNAFRRFHFSMGYGQNIHFVGDMLPQPLLPAVDGTLTMTDGWTTLTIPGCRLDEAHITRSVHGHIVRVEILGPSWKWKFGAVNGVYNVRRPDGSVIPETQRTTQQLAELLLQAMQVPVYDVSGLPNFPGPQVDWRGAVAFNELTYLCHSLGCDFGLDVNGTVLRIWKLGVGAGLPSGGHDVTEDYGIDFSEPPDTIRLYCGATIYQSMLKLKAVMEDTDHSLVDRDSVSYIPGTWVGTDRDDPLGPDADPEHRRLARKTNLRYFLVDTQADGSWNVPGYGTVTNKEDILPLRDVLADEYQESEYYQQRAYLVGTFAVDNGHSMANTPELTLCEVDFRIDKERGLVISNFPIYKLNSALQEVAPDLYLVTSYRVRNPSKFHYEYYSALRNVASNGTGEMPIHRPDLVRRVIASYTGTAVSSVSDNNSTLDPEISAQLDAAQAEFATTESLVKWYRGLMPISLSGAIRQFAFFGSCETGSPCYTIGSMNMEWEPGILTRRQRRLAAEADRIRVRRELDEVEGRWQQRRGLK